MNTRSANQLIEVSHWHACICYPFNYSRSYTCFCSTRLLFKRKTCHCLGNDLCSSSYCFILFSCRRFFEISIYWTFLFRFCWNFQGFVNRWALLLQFLDPRLKILVLLSSCVVFENDKWISIFVCVLTRPVSTFSYTINCSQLCKHRQTHTTFLKHFSKTLSASSIMLKFNKSLIGAYTTTFLYFFFYVRQRINVTRAKYGSWKQSFQI